MSLKIGTYVLKLIFVHFCAFQIPSGVNRIEQTAKKCLFIIKKNSLKRATIELAVYRLSSRISNKQIVPTMTQPPLGLKSSIGKVKDQAEKTSAKGKS